MTTIEATADLHIEVWPGGDGDTPLVKLVSASMQGDNLDTGSVVIWPEEISLVIEALTQAADLLASEEA